VQAPGARSRSLTKHQERRAAGVSAAARSRDGGVQSDLSLGQGQGWLALANPAELGCRSQLLLVATRLPCGSEPVARSVSVALPGAMRREAV
jgi:hypothetical protein